MQNTRLNIAANRSAVKYTRAEIICRALWGFVQLFFRFSPRNFFAWRRFLLRLFGGNIGREVHIYNSVVIKMPWNLEIGDWSSIGEHAYIYNLGKITIGSRTTISQRAHLCSGSHDYSNPELPLLKLPIIIRDEAWVCADAFVGPGVNIGEGAIVGARAVVVNNIKPWNIVAGNPSKLVGKRVLKNG